MKRISSKRFSKLFLLAFGLLAAGIVAASVTSCSGVDSSITSNMVSKGDGKQFGNNISLSDEVEQALTDKSSSDAFKKAIANKVLYQWYYNNTKNDKLRDKQIYSDNWKQWEKDAKKSYDDKVKSYKSDYSNNWPYYFQNEVLDPIGADGNMINPATLKKESPKDTYVRYQMYENIRNDFNSKVFQTNYFGLKKQDDTTFNSDYSLSSKVQKLTGTADVDNILMQNPDRWQTIDYYPNTKASYNPDIDLDWQFAYIQHVSFIEYTQTAAPISTSMILWKGADTGSDADGSIKTFKSIYNVHDDQTNPNGHVPSDAKVGYNFPLFNDKNFKNYIQDGFTGNNATFFFDGISGGTSDQGTDLVNIPVGGSRPSYGDDSATLIKVDRGSNIFTSLDVTFGATVVDLYNSYSNATSIQTTNQNIPLYAANGGQYVPSPNNLLTNFLFVDPTAVSSSNGVKLPTEFNNAAQVLGTTWNNGSKIDNQDYSAQGGQLDQMINQDTTGVHAEVFNHASQYYQQGYTDLISAFQLSNSTKPLPFVMIRERSGGEDGTGGIHMIGIDGTGYLGNTTGYNGNALNSSPWTQSRENDILKFRSLASKIGDDRYNQSFDFSNSDVKDYFNNNEDTIILQLANKMEGVVLHDKNDSIDMNEDYNSSMNSIDGSDDHDVFEIPSSFSDEIIWKYLWRISVLLDRLNIYEAVVKNYSDSFGKLNSFNSTEQTNLKYNGVNGPDQQDQSTYPTYDIYKNGLASKFPFGGNFSSDSSLPVNLNNKTWFDVQSSLNAPLDAYNIPYQDNNTISSSLKRIFNNNVWNRLSTDWIPTQAVGKSNSGMAKYSEHIYTRSEEINDLLDKFGGSNNFSNGYLVNAYKNYLDRSMSFLNADDGYFNNNGQATKDFDYSAMQEVLGSNMYVPAIFASPADLINTNSTTIANDGELTASAFNQWKLQKDADLSWNILPNDTLSNGYSSSKIDYYKTLSAIKYLLTNSDGEFSPKNFIDYQIKNMKYGTQNIFAWKSQDSLTYQDSTNGDKFGTSAPIFSDNTDSLPLYKMKANYGNALESRLNGINTGGYSSENYSSTTFVDNSDYLKFASAKMNRTSEQLMGFQGMVNSLNSVGEYENSALTTNFKEGNPFKNDTKNPYLGSLTQFSTIGKFIDIGTNKYFDDASSDGIEITNEVRNSDWFVNSLTGYLYNNKDNWNNISTIMNTINNSIPFDSVMPHIDDSYDAYTKEPNNWTSKRQTQALITSICNPNFKTKDSYGALDFHYQESGSDVELNNSFFTPITSPVELLNPDASTQSAVFLDSTGASTATRVLFSQIPNTSFYLGGKNNDFRKPADDTDYTEVWTNLINTYGESLIYNLVYKASFDTNIIANTTIAVRKLCNTNGKLVVYDRRYNDQLGYNWVNNYKDKN